MEGYIHLNSDDYRERIKELFKNDPGVYTLHWFLEGHPRKINRLIYSDPDGILYIGKTDRPLHLRVGMHLKESILENSDIKQKEPVIKGYNTLSQKFFRVRKHIKVDDLFVQLTSVTDKTPEEVESRMLEEYVRKYGELPPFNGTYGSQVMWELYC